MRLPVCPQPDPGARRGNPQHQVARATVWSRRSIALGTVGPGRLDLLFVLGHAVTRRPTDRTRCGVTSTRACIQTIAAGHPDAFWPPFPGTPAEPGLRSTDRAPIPRGSHPDPDAPKSSGSMTSIMTGCGSSRTEARPALAPPTPRRESSWRPLLNAAGRPSCRSCEIAFDRSLSRSGRWIEPGPSCPDAAFVCGRWHDGARCGA